MSACETNVKQKELKDHDHDHICIKLWQCRIRDRLGQIVFRFAPEDYFFFTFNFPTKSFIFLYFLLTYMNVNLDLGISGANELSNITSKPDVLLKKYLYGTWKGMKGYMKFNKWANLLFLWMRARFIVLHFICFVFANLTFTKLNKVPPAVSPTRCLPIIKIVNRPWCNDSFLKKIWEILPFSTRYNIKKNCLFTPLKWLRVKIPAVLKATQNEVKKIPDLFYPTLFTRVAMFTIPWP